MFLGSQEPQDYLWVLLHQVVLWLLDHPGCQAFLLHLLVQGGHARHVFHQDQEVPVAHLVLGHPYLPEVLLVLELLVYHPHPWYQEDRLPRADQQALVDPSFQDLQSLPTSNS